MGEAVTQTLALLHHGPNTQTFHSTMSPKFDLAWLSSPLQGNVCRKRPDRRRRGNMDQSEDREKAT